VIAARAELVVAQSRRAAKLAHHHDHDSTLQVLLENVFDQRRQTLIQRWEAESHVMREVPGRPAF
jgi:hypothetical protein